jgi:putative resolvase
MNKLIAIKEAAELLGVDPKTLRRWESDSKISPQKTIGGHRRYLLSEIEAMQGFEDEEQIDDIAIYCRVSSHEQKQKGDLDRQQARLVKHCAEKDYKIKYIYDEVGSGMSDNRRKLLKLMDVAADGKISKLVIEHKDRLVRFNFNLLKKYFESFGVEVEVIEDILPKSYESELVEDMLSLMSSFSARIYGKRSAENRKKLKQTQVKTK